MWMPDNMDLIASLGIVLSVFLLFTLFSI